MRAFLVGLLILVVPFAAVAQEDVAAAADAFSRAQEAELRGDFEMAAELYALADRIAPTPEALRSAALAAQRAGLHATAATHAEALISRNPNDRESRAIADEILNAHASSLARIEARCDAACRVLLDGRVVVDRAQTQHIFYARPGDRRLSASFEGGRVSEEQTMTLAAGETTRLEFEPAAIDVPDEPEGPQPPQTRGGGGISPGFFIAGLVLSATGGALIIWSGVEVLDAHSTYDPAAADAQARYAAGRELETRTNVIIGITSAFAVATAVLAIFTDWGGGGADASADNEGFGQLALGADDRSVGLTWTRRIP